MPCVLGSYCISREQHLHQRDGVHTLHLLINDEIDIGLIVNLSGLEQASNTTIAEDDVVSVGIGFGD